MRKQRKMSKPIMPPPVTGDREDLRALMARTALANESLMQGVKTPKEAVGRALRIADEMLRALRLPPSPEVKPLTEDEMKRWEEAVAFERNREPLAHRITEPAIPSAKTEVSRSKLRSRPALPGVRKKITKPYGREDDFRPVGPGIYRRIVQKDGLD